MKKIITILLVSSLFFISCNRGENLNGKILKDEKGNYYKAKKVISNTTYKRVYKLTPVEKSKIKEF